MRLLKIRSITQLKEITLHARKRKLLTYILLGSRLVFGEPQLDLVNSKNSQSGVIFRTLNQEPSMTTDFNQESST